MPRINVRTARKQYQCGNCKKDINVGDRYKWAKPRYGAKIVRCTNCEIPSSLLTSSEKKSRLYEQQENLYALASRAEQLDPETCSKEDLTTLHDNAESDIQQASSEVSSVADEYEEAAEHFGGQGTSAELAESVRDWETEIDNITLEDVPDEREDWQEWLETTASDIRDAADALDI